VPSPTAKHSTFRDPAARLRQARDELELSNAALARRADLSPATVNDALSGVREPQQATQYKLCAALRLNVYWMLTGQGEKSIDDATAAEYLARARPPSQTGLQAVASSLGVDRWLTDTPEGGRTLPDERTWLRSFPWPDPHARYPNLVYELTLSLYRQMRAFQGESPGATPPA
jgi:transcriptional regulator with XRE-family HTH domain